MCVEKDAKTTCVRKIFTFNIDELVLSVPSKCSFPISGFGSKKLSIVLSSPLSIFNYIQIHWSLPSQSKSAFLMN